MHLFGHYPAHDDFYLVVCNVCNQVVKPQVFQSHCDPPCFFLLHSGALLTRWHLHQESDLYQRMTSHGSPGGRASCCMCIYAEC
ncbi:hypothetical protein GDO81_028044 [Engystomops pustulosus]|uniref:Uncharacterized protein n=1 Tax=Engystomops pustulosus TaxID=76066 RepID=A0AAV6Z3H8_ENGPU|nr:hypothetical protein GDO81_028044 [Engystomops pustulosus]